MALSSLVGKWAFNFLVSVSMNFSADGNLEQISSFDGELVSHIKATYKIDESVTPNHLMATVTEIIVDHSLEESPLVVGDPLTCIYQVSTLTLDIACHRQKPGVFPANFDEGNHIKGNLFKSL